MKKLFLLGVMAFAAVFGNWAQEAKPGAPMNELETKFSDLLRNCLMEGRWTPLKDGELGEEKKGDKYNIVSATKVKDDSWIISTKMKYGEREMVVPIPVSVKWAGDTAVIIVDKLQMPGGGMYSARVLFFEKTYAGSWTGQKGGGLLSGVIVSKKE